MTRSIPNFQLAFPPTYIREYAKLFSYKSDKEARDAGDRIAKGDYSKENALTIVEWKTKRATGRFQKNAPAQVSAALKQAVDAISNHDDRTAVESLLTLKGVGVPVASTILTYISRQITIVSRQYTIIDFRALEALGYRRKGQPSLQLYLQYLGRCREIAEENGVSLRVLDKALWQWSKSSAPTN